MRQKLHRGKRPVFRKRNPALRIIGVTVAVLAIVAGGFFGAKFITERPQSVPATGTQEEQPKETAPTTSTTAPTTTAPSDTAPATATAVRGFYLPFSALSEDGLADTLAAAKKAGFNSVVFDLKDTEGKLYYRFSSATAAKVNSFVENALTEEQLKSLISVMRDAGLMPIPRLQAFRDHLGAKALADARIAHKDNAGWTWYDGDPSGGGRAWLNPYADEAHAYLIGLATELKEAGAAGVIFDSVQFPHQLSSAALGNDHPDLKADEALALFVKKARSALGDCPVILTCTAESALGSATQIYGGNPLTFGAAIASPKIFPGDLPGKIKVGETTIENTAENLQATVKALVAQMILRTKVLKEAPAVTPYLQAEGYSAAQIKAEIAGCQEGGSDTYILYHAKGTYDFGAY